MVCGDYSELKMWLLLSNRLQHSYQHMKQRNTQKHRMFILGSLKSKGMLQTVKQSYRKIILLKDVLQTHLSTRVSSLTSGHVLRRLSSQGLNPISFIPSC